MNRDKEIRLVIEAMGKDYPGASDYNVINDGRDRTNYVEILDASEQRIAVISAVELDHYWNLMEAAL